MQTVLILALLDLIVDTIVISVTHCIRLRDSKWSEFRFDYYYFQLVLCLSVCKIIYAYDLESLSVHGHIFTMNVFFNEASVLSVMLWT